MGPWIRAGVFAAGLLISTACEAQTIQPVRGDVLVSQGQGFSRINGRVGGNVGESVMVSPGGDAVIRYPDGCRVNLQPGTVFTISSVSPCQSSQYQQVEPGLVIVGVLDAAAIAAGIYEFERIRHQHHPIHFPPPPPKPASP